MLTTARRRLAVVATGATLVLSAAAIAATPENSTVSSETPRAAWTGAVTASYAPRVVTLVTESDAVPCEAPYCDTFDLNVAEAGKPLTIGADAPGTDSAAPDQVTLRIYAPDGELTIATGGATAGQPFAVEFEQSQKGTYTVEYMTYYIDGPTDYHGYASLGVPLLDDGSTPPPPAAPQTQAQPQPQPEQPPAEQAPAPAPAPAPVQALTVDVKAPALSARKLKRSKSFSIPITVSRGVSSVTATLTKGKKVVATGKGGALAGAGKLTVKTAKGLKAGTYKLTLTADDGAGVKAIKTVALKIKK
jgi:hypothetical protein